MSRIREFLLIKKKEEEKKGGTEDEHMRNQWINVGDASFSFLLCL